MTKYSDQCRTLLIIDLSTGGHHPTYIRRLLQSELATSCAIVVASRREMFSHPQIRPYQANFTAHEIEVAPSLDALSRDFGTLSLMRASWAIGSLYRRTYTQLAKSRDIGFVLVPFLDDCLVGLALSLNAFETTPWAAITMRTMFHFGAMGVAAPPLKLSRVRRYLFDRLLHQRSFAAMLTIDPTLSEFAQQQSDPGYQKIEYLPDPALRHELLPSREEARRQLGIPQDARLVALYGEIAARKGVFTLLDAAADPTCNPQLHVLLAGRYERGGEMLGHPAYLALMEQHRLHRIDGFVDDLGECRVLAAADCMWVAYTGFYLMSGVMVLAGRHALPVISSREGIIGHWTSERDIGMIVDTGERASVVAALNRVVAEPAQLTRMGENGAKAFAAHEPAVLAQLVARIFSRCT